NDVEVVQDLFGLVWVGGDVRVEPGQRRTHRATEQHILGFPVEVGPGDELRAELLNLVLDHVTDRVGLIENRHHDSPKILDKREERSRLRRASSDLITSCPPDVAVIESTMRS